VTAVAGNLGEWALGSLNAATPWLPLQGLSDDVCFDITGTFVGTVTIQTSNQDDFVKTRISSIASYTGAVSPLGIPRIAARWFRVQMTAYTSGTAYLGLSRPNTAGKDPIPVNLTGQMQTNVQSPPPDYFINPAGDP
jgi:hypothetical protein